MTFSFLPDTESGWNYKFAETALWQARIDVNLALKRRVKHLANPNQRPQPICAICGQSFMSYLARIGL